MTFQRKHEADKRLAGKYALRIEGLLGHSYFYRPVFIGRPSGIRHLTMSGKIIVVEVIRLPEEDLSAAWWHDELLWPTPQREVIESEYRV